MTTIASDLQSEATKAKLNRLARAVEPASILKVIGLRFMSYVDESFRTRGRGSWRPLSSGTINTRPRGGAEPLQDTGRYRQSFVQESDNQTYVEVGTNLKTDSGVVLAKIHERGTGPYTIRVKHARVLAAKAGPRSGISGWFFFGREVNHPGVPPRPVLPTIKEAERLILGSVEEMLEMEIKK